MVDIVNIWMIQVKQTTAVISSYYTQAKAQKKTIRVLSEMSVRLQTIEHRMEVLHMQPPSVTTTSGMPAKEDKKTPARIGREPELILAQLWGRPSLAGGVLGRNSKSRCPVRDNGLN